MMMQIVMINPLKLNELNWLKKKKQLHKPNNMTAYFVNWNIVNLIGTKKNYIKQQTSQRKQHDYVLSYGLLKNIAPKWWILSHQ